MVGVIQISGLFARERSNRPAKFLWVILCGLADISIAGLGKIGATGNIDRLMVQIYS